MINGFIVCRALQIKRYFLAPQEELKVLLVVVVYIINIKHDDFSVLSIVKLNSSPFIDSDAVMIFIWLKVESIQSHKVFD
jgi:hypothetical protein